MVFLPLLQGFFLRGKIEVYHGGLGESTQYSIKRSKKMQCNCLVCTGRSLESLPCYETYYQEYTKVKHEEGHEEDEEWWMSELTHYYDIQILRIVLKYAKGTCLYRMYRRINRLFSGDLYWKGDNKLMLDELNNLLTMSDSGVYIDEAFNLVLED
jgi:hypothetical protein